ncbi:hypothetical protein MaudCBS49596_006215 [Microsporum audouinii]
MPQMTKSDASRIQSTQARGGKHMSSSGFAARAQAAGDRNSNVSNTGTQSTGQGNKGGPSSAK